MNQYHLEVYTDKKDLKTEKPIEDVLDKYGVFYERTEVWIESEHLYEVPDICVTMVLAREVI